MGLGTSPLSGARWRFGRARSGTMSSSIRVVASGPCRRYRSTSAFAVASSKISKP